MPIGKAIKAVKQFRKPISVKENLGRSVAGDVIAPSKKGLKGDLGGKNIPDTFGKENLCYLILDQINDPQNFGQIIRTAECSGVDGIIYSKHNSVPVTNSVLQVSQGAFLNMSIFEVPLSKSKYASFSTNATLFSGMVSFVSSSIK